MSALTETNMVRNRKTLTRTRRVWNNRTLLFMCLPAIVFFLIFAYLPMPGLYLAFIKYNYTDGIFKSPFVGFDNFRFLVINEDLWRLTFNTVAYSLAFILLGNALQIFVAVLLNEIRRKWFKKNHPNHHVFAALHFSGLDLCQ